MSIDLNSDMGESYGHWHLGADEQLLELVTSANIACGFHAGDPVTLLETTRLAVQNQVQVGAQVSYADLRGFGRRYIAVPAKDLTADIIYQLGALQGMCSVHGGRISYVKPHGALYNTVVHDSVQAQAIVEAIVAFDPQLAVLGLPGSQLLHHASLAGLRIVNEVFADRAYNQDGTLVSRQRPEAVLKDVHVIVDRMVRLVSDGVLETITGSLLPLSADSICVHGDTPHAVEIAQAVKSAVLAAGIEIKAF